MVLCSLLLVIMPEAQFIREQRSLRREMAKSGSTQVHRKSHPSDEDLEQALEVAIANVGCKIGADPFPCEASKVRVVKSMTKRWGRATRWTVESHYIRRTWRGRRYLRLTCELGIFGVTTDRELIRLSPEPVSESGFPVLVADQKTGAAVPLRDCWQFFDYQYLTPAQQRVLLQLLQDWLDRRKTRRHSRRKSQQ